MRKILTLFAASVLLAACVSQVSPEKETVPAVSRAETPRPPSGDGLDSPAFGSIPPEAKAYLKTLAEAFRKKDRDFLIAQGESQFEREFRFRFDDETYLALLYRSGPYSEDLAWQPPVPPRLDYTQILAIEYTAWEEKGPMLDVKGRLYFGSGDTLPCGIMLAWRLPEPKIVGAYP